jgi:hypothetical protein
MKTVEMSGITGRCTYVFKCCMCQEVHVCESNKMIWNVMGMCGNCDSKLSDGKRTSNRIWEKPLIDEYSFVDHTLYDEPSKLIDNEHGLWSLLSTPPSVHK